jgi:hypothetical protein
LDGSGDKAGTTDEIRPSQKTISRARKTFFSEAFKKPTGSGRKDVKKEVILGRNACGAVAVRITLSPLEIILGSRSLVRKSLSVITF